MFNYSDFNSLIKRRTFIAGVTKGILGASLVGRLIYLQLFQRHHYEDLSNRNRILTRLLPPLRGEILDTNGKILSANKPNYRCVISNKFHNDKLPNNIYEIGSILNINLTELEKAIDILKKSKAPEVILKENLNFKEIAKLEIKSYEIEDILIEKTQMRFYPDALLFCHLIGYVAKANENDLNKYKIPDILGLKVGKLGIEKLFENKLRGNYGLQQLEVNSRRNVTRVISNTYPTAGSNLKLSINYDLQKKTYELLSQHRSACAIVMDAFSGKIKTYVSYPAYNNNEFVNGIESKKWQSILNHEDKPLIDKISSAQYSPGSAFKMMVGMSALQNGISKDFSVFCNGHMNLGDRRFHCWMWKYGGHGHINSLNQALTCSCDIYFYELALKLGVTKMCDMASMFGYGKKTNFGFDTEKKGLIPTPGHKLFSKSFFRQKGQALNVSIGQGAVLSTPIQLVRMISAFINNGNLVKPTFLEADQPIIEKIIGIEQENLEVIKKGMFDCVNSTAGTANASVKKYNDFTFCGKTGSTQVAKLTIAQRNDGSYANLDYHLRDHAIFVGYSNVEPYNAICVVIEHGKSGGRVAAPIAGEILYTAHKLS